MKMKLLIILLCMVIHTTATYNQDRIRLEDVKVLTLYSDRVTNGRRSSPVPQLLCVGGSAQNAYRPLTVQCYNRGFDGTDMQWECKTDMDNDFRFGKIEVTCEGYDYPEDPYILRGSCGLEYTLEYTKDGYQRQQNGHQGYHQQHNSHQGYQHDSRHGYHDKTGYHKSHFFNNHQSHFGTIVMLGIVAVVIYTIYTKCLSTNQTTAGDAPPPYTERDTSRQRPDAPRQRPDGPPPPGFKQDFMPGTQSAGQGFGSTGGYSGTQSTAGASTGGGFWTGAATGGVLGYLFGNRNNHNHHNTGYNRPYSSPGSSWFSGNSWGGGTGGGWGGNSWGGGGGSGWGGGGGSSWGGSSSSSSSSGSSGTRTASGFGGTKRR